MEDSKLQLETPMFRLLRNRDTIRIIQVLSMEGNKYRVRYTPRHARLEEKDSKYGIICHSFEEAQTLLRQRLEQRIAKAKELITRSEKSLELIEQMSSQVTQ